MTFTKEITANSRISFKQPTQNGDVFYTFEYSETRSIDPSKSLEQNRQELWNDCHVEVDKQVQEITRIYKRQ